MSIVASPALGPAPRHVFSLTHRTRPLHPRGAVRRAARLQDPAAADLVDIPSPRGENSESHPFPSSSSPSTSSSPLLADPGASSSPSSQRRQQEGQRRQRLVSSLLALSAATDRGAGGTRRERAAVESLASRLERSSTTRRSGTEGEGDRDLFLGTWSLVYSSAQPFRSSPFFWGFSRAMGSVAAAEAVFGFTDALPFARIGSAKQEVTRDVMGDGSCLLITSDVGLTVAGASGRVVTESSASLIEGDGRGDDEDRVPVLSLSVRPVSTRVEGSPLLRGPLARARVPVGVALDAVAALTSSLAGADPESSPSSSSSNSCATTLEITYVDDVLRIGRTPRDGHLFVYVRD